MRIQAFVIAAFLSACSTNPRVHSRPVAPTPPTATIGMDDQILGEHVIKTMNYVRSPLSPIQRQLLAQTLVIIANNTFETLDQKKNWIYVLAIESKFDNSARSPVGAAGIGQVMPQYAKEFGKYCGMKDVRESDVNDLLVNATLSACVWRKMLDTVPDNSVILALAAYNSGPSSSSTKGIQGLGSAVPETANYIARFSYLKEVTEHSTRVRQER